MIKIDKTAKIWQPTTILETDREIDIGPECRIGQFCFIAPRKLVMERGAEISPQATLGGGGDIIMHKYSCVDFGARLIPATFTTDGLYMNDAMLKKDPKKVDVVRGSITLLEGAVVATNAIVCVSRDDPHIMIGMHSVIGAGTYIDKSVPDNTIVRPVKTMWEEMRRK